MSGGSGSLGAVTGASNTTTSSSIEIEDLNREFNDKVHFAPASAASNQLVLHAKEPDKMSGDQKVLLKGHASQYVKLNVGGRLYYTTIGTLTKHNDTMLSAMFSGRMEVLTDSEGIHKPTEACQLQDMINVSFTLLIQVGF